MVSNRFMADLLVLIDVLCLTESNELRFFRSRSFRSTFWVVISNCKHLLNQMIQCNETRNYILQYFFLMHNFTYIFNFYLNNDFHIHWIVSATMNEIVLITSERLWLNKASTKECLSWARIRLYFFRLWGKIMEYPKIAKEWYVPFSVLRLKRTLKGFGPQTRNHISTLYISLWVMLRWTCYSIARFNGKASMQK